MSEQKKKEEGKGGKAKSCPIRLTMGYKPQVLRGKVLPQVVISNAHVSESDAA